MEDAQRRLRLLWLAPYLPVPTSGAGTRIFHLLQALSPNADIDLVTCPPIRDAPPEAYRAIGDLCASLFVARPVAASTRQKRALQLRSLISRRPAQFWLFRSCHMAERVRRLLNSTSYDAVVVEHSFTAYNLPKGLLDTASRPPIILDQHNVESEILLRSGSRERTPLRRWYNRRDYVRYLRDEQTIARHVDLVIATSDREREAMAAWGGLPQTMVIPNGVDTVFFSPLPAETAENTVVFTGTMNYGPNVEAILHFTSEIWPLIRAELPGVSLRIVGQGPPPEVIALANNPEIVVTGFVEDVRPHLASARVVIAPLRIGGGTRLKILEAMAMGKPVVSTSLGCEGLDVENGRHLLIADSTSDFASAVLQVSQDPALASRLGNAGRRLVVEHYDWQQLGNSLKEALATPTTKALAPQE